MKKSQKAVVYLLVALMVLSTAALTALVFVNGSSSDEDDQTEVTTTETEQVDTIEQQVNEEDYVGTAVEGVEWPIVLEESLDELVIEDLVVGEGVEAVETSTVTVNYRLAEANGIPVPGNDTFAGGSPFSRPLSELIVAWQQGIPGMKEGGVRRLKVPSALAYGNGDLVFDVELLEVK